MTPIRRRIEPFIDAVAKSDRRRWATRSTSWSRPTCATEVAKIRAPVLLVLADGGYQQRYTQQVEPIAGPRGRRAPAHAPLRDVRRPRGRSTRRSTSSSRPSREQLSARAPRAPTRRSSAPRRRRACRRRTARASASRTAGTSELPPVANTRSIVGRGDAGAREHVVEHARRSRRGPSAIQPSNAARASPAGRARAPSTRDAIASPPDSRDLRALDRAVQRQARGRRRRRGPACRCSLGSSAPRDTRSSSRCVDSSLRNDSRCQRRRWPYSHAGTGASPPISSRRSACRDRAPARRPRRSRARRTHRPRRRCRRSRARSPRPGRRGSPRSRSCRRRSRRRRSAPRDRAAPRSARRHRPARTRTRPRRTRPCRARRACAPTARASSSAVSAPQ